MNLGLTRLQATTYLTLSKLGRAGVKEIATASNVYRSDSYRVMLSLEKLGLAEKIMSDPVSYRATPLREGFDLLMQNKTKEYVELQREATKALDSFQSSNQSIMLQSDDPHFVVCSSEKLFFRTFTDRHNGAKNSIDSIVNWRSISAGLIDFHKDMEKIIDKGVKMRTVTEKHEDDHHATKIIQDLKKNPHYELRYIPAPVPAELTIYDGAEVDLRISLANGIPTPSLWSNHAQLLEIMKTYFETIWAKSEESST